jgi:hypothetical protein
MYNIISSSGTFTGGVSGISVIAGLTADELIGYPVGNSIVMEAYPNALISTDAPFWDRIYVQCIYPSNAAIEGISKSTTLTQSVQQQLLGEAKFMRALAYFYLVNFFGDIPLITTTDFSKNQLAFRNAQAEVYNQIISDLKNAQILLSPNYLDATLLNTTTERVRPTQWAATALLARVYLYTHDWINAEKQSSTIISNTTQYKLVSSLNGVFIKNSTEAIWQLQPVISGRNTEDGNAFILSSIPTSANPVSLSSSLLNSFELNDARKTNWINSYTSGTQIFYFPYKYKIKTSTSTPSEYLMVLRLAEQYLIRAEAENDQGNMASAIADLNTIRNRAGLANYSGLMDQNSVQAAIQHERQVELFTEWGHRWLDLKRTQKIDSVMTIVSPQKGGTWKSSSQLFPLPLQPLQYDHNLTQNPGYN